MPDHHSPTLVAQQVRTKLLRESLAPLSESRESDGPSAQSLLALQPLPRICLPRAKSFADFGNEVPIDQGVDISRPFFRRFATWSDLVSRRICFQGSAVDVQRAM